MYKYYNDSPTHRTYYNIGNVRVSTSNEQTMSVVRGDLEGLCEEGINTKINCNWETLSHKVLSQYTDISITKHVFISTDNQPTHQRSAHLTVSVFTQIPLRPHKWHAKASQYQLQISRLYWPTLKPSQIDDVISFSWFVPCASA